MINILIEKRKSDGVNKISFSISYLHECSFVDFYVKDGEPIYHSLFGNSNFSSIKITDTRTKLGISNGNSQI